MKYSCKRVKKQWIETTWQEAEHATAKNDARSRYKIVRELAGSRPNTSILSSTNFTWSILEYLDTFINTREIKVE